MDRGTRLYFSIIQSMYNNYQYDGMLFIIVTCTLTTEQFSSLLSDHPEYVLVLYECQHAGISSPPHTSASLVTNGNQHSPIASVAAAKPGGVSDEHDVDRHGQVIETVSEPILT